MKVDFQPTPAPPSFWDRWKDVLLMATIGFGAVVIGVFAKNQLAGEHVSGMGVIILSGAGAVWLLRVGR